MKKAFVDHLLLGAFLFVIVIVFVSTVNDDRVARDKIFDLKQITDTAVRAAGTYYIDVSEDETSAETISDDILEETKLGREVTPLLSYNWDYVSNPDRLVVNIQNYRHDNFWYKFLDLDSFILQATSIGILDNGYVTNFVPIVVNGCSQIFSIGDTFDYLLKSYDLYDENDNVGFFGAYDPGGGQSSFAHLKNLVKDVMDGNSSEFDLDNDLNVSTVDSSQIANDVKQIAQSFGIAAFSDTPMSIVEAQCGSVADNLIIERVFEITMNGVYCGDGCLNPAATNGCSLLDLSGDVFSDTAWDTAVNACNSETFFRINFRIDNIREREVVIQN